MKKKFYRFPNGSYFRLDSISFVGKVQECGCRYRKYKLSINVDGNTLDSEADDYDYLEKARRELLKELHLEYMPIPLRRIRRCRRRIVFRNVCRKRWHEFIEFTDAFGNHIRKLFFPFLP